MEIYFEIIGNQENEKGNPIGYHRTTQGSYWNKGSKRYFAWKQYVVEAYLKVLPKDEADRFRLAREVDKKLKPISEKKAFIEMNITYGSRIHADQDNIFKGIADALFINDKEVDGMFRHKYGASGKVEVRIKTQKDVDNFSGQKIET